MFTRPIRLAECLPQQCGRHADDYMIVSRLDRVYDLVMTLPSSKHSNSSHRNAGGFDPTDFPIQADQAWSTASIRRRSRRGRQSDEPGGGPSAIREVLDGSVAGLVVGGIH